MDRGCITFAQTQCVQRFTRAHADVVVQAPTGSGKTFAYALPLIEHVRTAVGKRVPLKHDVRAHAKNSCVLSVRAQIYALVLVPNRELAIQVERVIQPLATVAGLTSVAFVGGAGTPLQRDVQRFADNGAHIIVATPGRFAELIDAKNTTADAASKQKIGIKDRLRTCDILIADECDRLLDTSFTTTLSTILSAVPKQRRTGLFSATFIQDDENLTKFSMRNLVRIKVGGNECTPTSVGSVLPSRDDNSSSEDSADETVAEKIVAKTKTPTVMPDNLSNYYAIIIFSVVNADAKLSTLIGFLQQHTGEKILVFFSTCACVDYFAECVQRVWPRGRQRIVAVHGHKKKQRPALFDKFRSAGVAKQGGTEVIDLKKPTTGKQKRPKAPIDPHAHTVMFATDVMARGVDIPSIDWVVQYEPPRQSAWFIHRSGRSARCGRLGSALVLLTPSELGYVDFMHKHENVDMQKLDIKIPVDAHVCTRRKIIHEACKDRKLLNMGTRAFVSSVQAYAKHDCHVVCNVKDLDVVGCAHDYALLRLPKMPELSNRDLSGFQRTTTINTADIPYTNTKLEEQRQKMLVERRELTRQKKERYEKKLMKQQQSADNESTGAAAADDGANKSKRKRKSSAKDDAGDFSSDLKLMKKLKKGRLSHEEFTSQFMQ